MDLRGCTTGGGIGELSLAPSRSWRRSGTGGRPGRRGGRRCCQPWWCACLAPHPPGQAHLGHEALDPAAGHDDALPVQLAPHLAGPIDAVVSLEHSGDVDPSGPHPPAAGDTVGASWPPSRWRGRPAGRCRSARPPTPGGGRRCRRAPGLSAVELRPEENGRRLEDLVRPPQLAHLPLQLGHALLVFAGGAHSLTAIDLGLTQLRSDSVPSRADGPPGRSPRSTQRRDVRWPRPPCVRVAQAAPAGTSSGRGGLTWLHHPFQAMEPPWIPGRFTTPVCHHLTTGFGVGN